VQPQGFRPGKRLKQLSIICIELALRPFWPRLSACRERKMNDLFSDHFLLALPVLDQAQLHALVSALSMPTGPLCNQRRGGGQTLSGDPSPLPECPTRCCVMSATCDRKCTYLTVLTLIVDAQTLLGLTSTTCQPSNQSRTVWTGGVTSCSSLLVSSDTVVLSDN